MTLFLAIVDCSALPPAFVWMDEAAPVTAEVAIGGARTAAYLGAPSKLFEDMINTGQASMATVPGLLPLQGGVPVLLEGAVIGAVGVSGSSGENDQDIATRIAECL